MLITFFLFSYFVFQKAHANIYSMPFWISACSSQLFCVLYGMMEK